MKLAAIMVRIAGAWRIALHADLLDAPTLVVPKAPTGPIMLPGQNNRVRTLH